MKLSPSAEKECSGFFSETERLRYAGNARQRFREVFPAVFLAPLLTDLAPLFTLDFTAEAAFFTLPFTAFISERAFLSARLISFLTSAVSGVFFSADLKTYNNYGFGLSVISSDEGGGFIKSNSIGLSYSWRGYFNKEKNIYFQLGVKGSYYDERLNPNKYIYSGNLHEIYGNILPLPALDIVNEKQNYWDFSTGFMIYVPWERHYREFMHNFIGFSVNHFTRPKDNFIEENARIPIKLSLQWNSFIRTSLYSLDKKSSLYVCPGLLYENRGDRLLSSSSFDNFIVGSDITTDPLFGGVWYSSQLLNSDKENYKAIIFKLGLKLNSANKKFEYRLAYSYDMSLGNLVKSTEGSHEISFNITYRFNAKYRYNIFSF